MTDQNNAAQPGLTDDQIEALAKKHIAPHADRLEAIMTNPVPYQQTEQFRRVKALIGDLLSKLRAEGVQAGDTFQARVQPWMMNCFGPEISADRQERNHRFIEEALELVQACGATASEAHQLVDYVFGRPVGEPHQEAGGVMVTLAALCLANGLDMHDAGNTELSRISEPAIREKIRAKQAAKPKHSPLPLASAPVAGEAAQAARWRWILPHLEIENDNGDEMGRWHSAISLKGGQIDLPGSPHYTTVEQGVDAARITHAAPQASEAVPMHKLAVAALNDLLLDIRTELGLSTTEEGPAILDTIRALKTQADKDGAVCSCPSGDGSLRHPCAVHPDCAKGAGVPSEPLRVFSAGMWTYDGTGQAFSHTDLDAAAFVTYRDALAAQKQGDSDA